MTVKIFPRNFFEDNINAFTDQYWHGNSIIEDFTYDSNTLVLKYVLKDGITSPLVFLSIGVGSPGKGLDLSDYTSVSLRIKEISTKKVLLFIKTFTPGVSLPGPENTYSLRHNQFTLQVVPGKNSYQIDIDKFITPAWWSAKMNEPEIQAESYREVITIDLQFNKWGAGNKLDQHESVIIENISFHRPLSRLSWVLIGSVIVLYIGLGNFLFIWKLRKKILNHPTTLPEQKPLKVSLQRENELLRIIEFIEANYHDARISTMMIYQKLGIPKERVFKLLKEEYNLRFKQLINAMRIREAKRLLKETDLRVIDIALKLGFNTISYFNNLFKLDEGQTPSDYRRNG